MVAAQTSLAQSAVALRAPPTAFSRVLAAGRREPRLIVFGGLIVVMVVVAIFAPLLAPYDPYQTVPTTTLQQPSFAHPLGTNSLGRDQLSRVIWGTRISLTVAVIAVSISLGGG